MGRFHLLSLGAEPKSQYLPRSFLQLPPSSWQQRLVSLPCAGAVSHARRRAGSSLPSWGTARCQAQWLFHSPAAVLVWSHMGPVLSPHSGNDGDGAGSECAAAGSRDGFGTTLLTSSCKHCVIIP